jgi:hypothetical protein
LDYHQDVDVEGNHNGNIRKRQEPRFAKENVVVLIGIDTRKNAWFPFIFPLFNSVLGRIHSQLPKKTKLHAIIPNGIGKFGHLSTYDGLSG